MNCQAWVYRFENRMLPIHLVYSGHPRHVRLANIAFGGEDRRTLVSCRP